MRCFTAIGLNRFTAFGLLAVIVLFGCGAAANWNFVSYGLDAKNYDGTLRARDQTGKDDIPLSTCQPDDKKKGKCIVMLSAEYFRLKNDDIATHQALIDLQHKCPQP